VSDNTGNKIHILSSLGQFISNITLGKTIPGSNYETAFCVDRDGNVVATAPGSVGINVMNKTGKVVAQFGQQVWPRAIACNFIGEILVLSGDHHIVTFDQKRNLKFAIPVDDKPYSIAVDPNNDNLVISYESNYVTVSDKDGNTKTYGNSGYQCFKFNSPKGVFVDGDSNILVADSNNSQIKIIDKNGNFRKPIEIKCSPLSVAVDYEGNVFVTTQHGILKYSCINA